MITSPRLWQVLDRAGIVALLVASSAVVWSTLDRGLEAVTQGSMVAQDVDATLTADAVADAAAIGEKGARLAIVEFSDYQCPYCAQYKKEVHPSIEREFVSKGKAKYIFFNFPLDSIHPFARKAAEAAECAGTQGKYLEMHTMLFGNQRSLKHPDLLRYAGEIGLDLAKFTQCLENEMSPRIDRHTAIAKRLGITSTPSFAIGEVRADGSLRIRKKINGALPYETFEAALKSIEG